VEEVAGFAMMGKERAKSSSPVKMEVVAHGRFERGKRQECLSQRGRADLFLVASVQICPLKE